jgi:hypothetical protein
MFYRLKRHPFPVIAHFRHCLVLTYALPHDALQHLLPPGLIADHYGDLGFLAVALVQTEGLRPAFLPRAFGVDFCLSGYRIFTRVAAGRNSLRGLRILRSGTNRRLMARAGNLFTHYNYTVGNVDVQQHGDKLRWIESGLDVIADISSRAPLPDGSPFANEKDARRFAGPLPFTFDYEAETHSLIRIRGVRPQWDPQLVRVHVAKNTFIKDMPAQLASAFYVHDLPYRWERGVRMPLERAQ